MASTNDFLELLENPDFNILVAQITAVVAKSQENGANANEACDALQYVNALIYEASPFNEGPKGLRDAHKQISVDAKAMLAFIRDASLRQGKPVLFSMLEQPTIN
jgi:hypothetical protein